jgi:hypothetical protein
MSFLVGVKPPALLVAPPDATLLPPSPSPAPALCPADPLRLPEIKEGIKDYLHNYNLIQYYFWLPRNIPPSIMMAYSFLN